MLVLSFWKEFFHSGLCLNKSNAVVIYGLCHPRGKKECLLGSLMVESMYVCGRIQTSSCVGKSFIGWSDYKQTALNTGVTAQARPWGHTLSDAVWYDFVMYCKYILHLQSVLSGLQKLKWFTRLFAHWAGKWNSNTNGHLRHFRHILMPWVNWNVDSVQCRHNLDSLYWIWWRFLLFLCRMCLCIVMCGGQWLTPSLHLSKIYFCISLTRYMFHKCLISECI